MKKNVKVSGQSSKIGIVLERERTASEMKDGYKRDLELVHITVKPPCNRLIQMGRGDYC